MHSLQVAVVSCHAARLSVLWLHACRGRPAGGGLGVTHACRITLLCSRVAGRHSRVARTNWGRHLWILVACTSWGLSVPARCGWVGDTAPWLVALQTHAVHLGLQGLRWIRHCWVRLVSVGRRGTWSGGSRPNRSLLQICWKLAWDQQAPSSSDE